MNLIEQLLREGRKEELIELFGTMQMEMRELNRGRDILRERIKLLERKVSRLKKLLNQTQKIEW